MAMLERLKPGIGTGLYDASDASRILEAPKSTVIGWLKGYTYRASDGVRQSDPVVPASRKVLTFYEVIELFIVRQYRRAGVPLPEIRDVGDALRQRLGTPYPFAARLLWVDGKRLLEDFGLEYRHPSSGQVVFGFASQFFIHLDFENDLPTKYFPLGRDATVVLDPEIQCGQAVIKGTRTTTRSIYNSWNAELGDFKRVSEWYEVPEDAVRDAVEIESRWAKVA